MNPPSSVAAGVSTCSVGTEASAVNARRVALHGIVVCEGFPHVFADAVPPALLYYS